LKQSFGLQGIPSSLPPSKIKKRKKKKEKKASKHGEWASMGSG
jgi:hypothetical protein